MNATQLFETIGDIDERFLEEAVVSSVHRPVWIKWAAVAASAALVVAVGSTVWHYAVSPTAGNEPTNGETAVTDVWDKEEMVQSMYSDYMPSTIQDGDRELYVAAPSLTSYSELQAGQIAWDMAGAQTFLDRLKETDLVWLAVYPEIPSQGIMGEAGRKAEALRLAEQGLEVYTRERQWTGYWGEEVHRTDIAVVMTVAQARNFPVREDYSYMISYVRGEKSEYTRVIPE